MFAQYSFVIFLRLGTSECVISIILGNLSFVHILCCVVSLRFAPLEVDVMVWMALSFIMKDDDDDGRRNIIRMMENDYFA